MSPPSAAFELERFEYVPTTAAQVLRVSGRWAGGLGGVAPVLVIRSAGGDRRVFALPAGPMPPGADPKLRRSAFACGSGWTTVGARRT